MNDNFNYDRAARITLDSFAASLARGLEPALQKSIAAQVSEFFLQHLGSGACHNIGEVEALYPALAQFLHDVKPYEDIPAPDQPSEE